ncbi:hypothetical protein Taro_035063 [Colocasia esculenta]|uniref:Uncharacterized protein n=1 Tax=Colocasia esculenta TaxID=4460 RepID=A0A843WC24_COLES|nr:hypothetical protein [Colocasia esculenta]
MRRDSDHASSGVATHTVVATPAERQTHGMLHPRAAHKPHTYHTREGSMEKLETLSTNPEGLPIHQDQEGFKQSLP